MADFGRRSRKVLFLLTGLAVCLTLSQAPLLSAKDKPDPKKKSHTEKNKKKSKSDGDAAANAIGSSLSGNSSGSGGVVGPASSAQTGGSRAAITGGGAASASPTTGSTAMASGSSHTTAGSGNPGKGPNRGDKGGNVPAQLDANHPIVKKAIDSQKRITPDLLRQKGIVGTSIGLDEDDNVVIKIRTTGADNPQFPRQVDGLAVVEVQTGPIRPFYQQTAFDTKARQPRPVPLGVSAISENGNCGDPDLAAGTLGARLRDSAGNVYALSNNHVFAAENAGVIGDLIVQPGSLDAFVNDKIPFCAPADVIGTLFKFKPIDVVDLSGNSPLVFNVIDAAVIKTDTNTVSNSTPPPPIAYGTPRTTTWKNPFLGLKIQKIGRTTGYNKGFVSGLNVTTSVMYTPGLAYFDQQIELTATNAASVGAPGDSGSLIVTDDPLGQRFPVSLLFAGGGGITDSNPIQAVLDFFDMTIDGDGTPFPSPGKNGRAAPDEP